jgi:glycosyltransferase involved in cell wall biosynthesis
MKILLGVHQFFPHHYTGTERYVLNLAKQFQRLGHRVRVLTYNMSEDGGFIRGAAPGILRKESTYEGVPVTAFRHREIPSTHDFVFDLADGHMYEEMTQLFGKERYDIYHCAHPLRIVPSLRAAREAGVKTVLMVTDFWLLCPRGILLRADNELCAGPGDGQECLRRCFPKGRPEVFRRRVEEARRVIEQCDCLLSPSLFLIDVFRQTGFVPPERFVLSRHGFDYRWKKGVLRKESGEKLTFGYIGTVQYHKGVHVMVEGFMRTDNPRIRLEVWGGCFHEVEYDASIRKMARRDSRITFKGQYDYNDVETILAGIDVVIVPSIWYENAPLTITTSLAYGIPVITSDIGGMSEMAGNGKNGFTFRAGDAADLALKIEMMAANPETVRTFKKNIEYPLRVEEEAFHTEAVYADLLRGDSM